MAKREVFRFFQDLAQKPELVLELRTQSKTNVLTHATQAGYLFSEAEFDEAIWGLEMYLAKKLGEVFDLSFSLWETMWGKYYLEFLVDNTVGAATDDDIDIFLNGNSEPK